MRGLSGAITRELMLAELVGVPIEVLAPGALCGVFVLLVFFGYLVPRRTHQDAIDRGNEWMTECRLRDQQIVVKDEQLTEKDKQLRYVAEVGETAKAVLTALQLMRREKGGDS